jgi:hypothetical protein
MLIYAIPAQYNSSGNAFVLGIRTYGHQGEQLKPFVRVVKMSVTTGNIWAGSM